MKKFNLTSLSLFGALFMSTILLAGCSHTNPIITDGNSVDPAGTYPANAPGSDGDRNDTPTNTENPILEDSTSNGEDVSMDITDAEDNALPISAGSYIDYSPEALKSALQSGEKVVLFFHSKICSSCKLLDNNLNKDLNSIPTGVTIIKLDYETELSLGKQYNVRSYNTIVYLDSDGASILKKTGNILDLNDITENL